MTAHAPSATDDILARVGRRVGYALALGANVALLWVVHQLLAWGWPGFLTEDFDRVLPVVTAALVAGIVVDVALIVEGGERLRAPADLVTAGFCVAVMIRTWTVFPFDFSGWGRDWSWLLRVGIVALGVACAIAVVANAATLVARAARAGERT